MSTNRESERCLLCGTPTMGSTGAARIFWPRLCQPCKDREDAAALTRARAFAALLRPAWDRGGRWCRHFCQACWTPWSHARAPERCREPHGLLCRPCREEIVRPDPAELSWLDAAE